MTACGSPQRAATTTTQNDTSDRTPLFDTSSKSPTGTSTANLFDTQTATTQTPSTGASTLGSVTQSESTCLASDSGFNLGSYGAKASPSTAAKTTSCFNSSSFGVDPNLLYEGAETSYKTADYCLGEAASLYAPQPGDTQTDIELSSKMAELSLIRCMRDLVKYQSNLVPWANAQASAYSNADHNLWYLGQSFR